MKDWGKIFAELARRKKAAQDNANRKTELQRQQALRAKERRLKREQIEKEKEQHRQRRKDNRKC